MLPKFIYISLLTAAFVCSCSKDAVTSIGGLSGLQSGTVSSGGPSGGNGGPAPHLPAPGSGNFGDTSLILDIDTSHIVYQFSSGTTDRHDHCYNCTFKTTVFDAFNTLDSALDNISTTLPAGLVFNIIVGNASLSPTMIIEINGTSYYIADYAKMVSDTIASGGGLTNYTLGTAGQGTQKLTELRLGLPASATLNGALVDTATPCVRANDPGPNGQYRNGALVVQAVPASGFALNAKTGTAPVGTSPFWEVSAFNHVTPQCLGGASAPPPGPPGPAGPPAPDP